MDERRIAAVDQWQKSEIVWLGRALQPDRPVPGHQQGAADGTDRRAAAAAAAASRAGPIDPDKPVALVKLKGMTTDDELATGTDAGAGQGRGPGQPANPKGKQHRRPPAISRVEWGTTYQLAHQDRDQIAARKGFTATPPGRGRSRNRGRGGPDSGNMMDMFLNGGPAMTTRERRMSIMLIGFILVAGVGFFGYQFVSRRSRPRASRSSTLDDEISQRRSPDRPHRQAAAGPGKMEEAEPAARPGKGSRPRSSRSCPAGRRPTTPGPTSPSGNTRRN